MKVGDIAIITKTQAQSAKFPVGTEWPVLEVANPPKAWGSGKECTISGCRGATYLIHKENKPGEVAWTYGCDNCLKPKKPPEEPLGEWDLCPWRPGKTKSSSPEAPLLGKQRV